jgi:hypothetical protein
MLFLLDDLKNDTIQSLDQGEKMLELLKILYRLLIFRPFLPIIESVRPVASPNPRPSDDPGSLLNVEFY